MGSVDTIDWSARATGLEIPDGLYVDGRREKAESERDHVTPRDGSVLGQVPWAGRADADRAVAAARRAFDEGPWPRMHPRERGEVLQRFAALVEQHRDELALLVSLEMGKPIRVAHEIELRALARTLRYYGELADKEHGEVTPTGEGELSLVTREPTGVVAAVVPWNFPLTIAGWKLAPALAAGCTVVLKTAEQSPLSMLRVAELGTEAGLPAGALNVLTGEGTVVGRALGEHPDVDVLTFTGSTAVGRHFLRYAADSNLKRVYLELGGKSPNIVLPDAPDLDAAAETAAWAIFFNSGEMCTAGSRLVVHRDVADEVVERVVDRAADWTPGDPLDPATRMGPMVDERSLSRVLGQLQAGRSAGATRAHRRFPPARRRALPRADGGHRARGRQPAGARGVVRAGARGAGGRRRGAGGARGRGHAVRACRGAVDLRPGHRPPGLAQAAGRHGVGELLRGGRPQRALRRRQAVGQRPRQVAPRARRVHRPQDHLDQLWVAPAGGR